MGSELDGLDRVDIPEPPEVLAEGTAVVEQDGRLAVSRQGLTLAVEEDFPTHAEVEQERRFRLEVHEDPFSSRRHAVHPCMDEQLPELVGRYVQTPGLDDVNLGHTPAAEFLVHLSCQVSHFG